MDGSDQKNLTSNSSDDYAYQITPDGMKILFTSNREGNDDIYLMDLDGGNVTNLTFTTENEYRPKVTNDGSKIFYISSVGINYTKVSSMNIDGSSIDIKYWTGKDNRFWLSPLDETFLLYASQQYSSPRPNIHRMNIDYSDPELLINFYYSTDVDFHPSDKNIFAYIGREQNESKFKIYLYDMSNMSYITNSRKELIDDPSILGYYDPTFSMDGNKIYVRVQNNDGDLSTSIYSMNLDGTNFTKIFDGEIDYIDGGNMFKFSNDGEYIYTSHRKNASVSDILVMNIDGTDQKYLTSSNRFNRFVDLIINN